MGFVGYGIRMVWLPAVVICFFLWCLVCAAGFGFEWRCACGLMEFA